MTGIPVSPIGERRRWSLVGGVNCGIEGRLTSSLKGSQTNCLSVAEVVSIVKMFCR